MKPFFREMLDYTFRFNQENIALITGHGDKVPEKVLSIQSHLLNVHHLWNRRISGLPVLYKPWDVQLQSDMKQLDENNYQESRTILENFALDQPVTYVTGNGKEFTHTVHELLFQVINHGTYHRGQIALELRRSGIQPLLTDWIYYKMT
jgi:uncharacterized damage-inducible protein DinB